MTHEISPSALSQALGARYYLLALGAASARNLSAALLYARYAVLLDHEHQNAVKLLGLCRYELGEPGSAESLEENSGDRLEKVRLLVAEKKWREAARAARALPHQSVRVLNMQGCLWALAKDPAKGSDYFVRALGKDRFNQLAAEGLAELTLKRKPFWNIPGRIL
ncbi:MAG: hypothetical protein LBB98_15315 [Treponema sp.]|jgi:Tfp pilus assembly protein PilF|nr:hypothetical protein [Treponema sp.]